MIGIPDWSNEPLANLEEIAQRNAEIDAELAEAQQQLLASFERVPSYVDRFKESNHEAD